MKQVWHIYYATKGTAGAYIDELLKASQIAGVDSCAFVSCNYRYKFGKLIKCFFPITDFIDNRGIITKYLRGVELVLAYMNTLVLALFCRPVIVIHLIDDFSITHYFFRFCKALGLKVRVTCHDVSSHYSGLHQNRSKMISSADELIVHNNAAEKTLINLFGSEIKSKIKQYAFPYSAYDEIISKDRLKSVERRLRQQLGTDYYLFLGVVRRSKGIETLLASWHKFNRDKKHKLVIAGRWTDPGDSSRNYVKQDNSIIVIDRYLDDEEFVQLIRDARFVLMPYLNSAHSSIIMSCGHHSGAVIVSDIELFRRLLPNYPLTFESGNVEALTNVLKKTAGMSAHEIKKIELSVEQSIKSAGKSLVEDLKVAYGS